MSNRVETSLAHAPTIARVQDRGPGTAGPSFADIFRHKVCAAERARTTPMPIAVPEANVSRTLALQAEIYRQAERVELASRLVDHAVGAAKTLLQTRF